tara:strand:- start:1249 stop:1482 length:234 start_codon:yes stop_codon:yes gene_type:complete
MHTPLQLLSMDFDDAVDAVMQDTPGIERNVAEQVVNTVFTGGDVVAIDESDIPAYESDPDSFLKARQRQKYLSEQPS